MKIKKTQTCDAINMGVLERIHTLRMQNSSKSTDPIQFIMVWSTNKILNFLLNLNLFFTN